jgi:hypothetical protein
MNLPAIFDDEPVSFQEIEHSIQRADGGPHRPTGELLHLTNQPITMLSLTRQGGQYRKSQEVHVHES